MKHSLMLTNCPISLTGYERARVLYPTISAGVPSHKSDQKSHVIAASTDPLTVSSGQG